MLEGLLQYLIGNIDSTALKKEIKESKNDVIKKNFGIIGGDVYFIKTLNISEVDNLFNELDLEKNSRKANKIVDFFVGGSTLAGRSGEQAFSYHNAFQASLMDPLPYIETLVENLKNSTLGEQDLKTFIMEPVQTALTKTLFSVEKLPSNLKSALNQFLNIRPSADMAPNVLSLLVGSYYHSLLYLNLKFYSARRHYIHAVESFLENQSQKILTDIKDVISGRESKNIITLSLIQLMKDKNTNLSLDELNKYILDMDLKKFKSKYLFDPYIRTLPVSLAPSLNFVILLSCAFSILSTDNNLRDSLREHLQDLDTTQSKNILDMIHQDRARNGLLHQFYLECCRRQDQNRPPEEIELETMQVRYTSKQLNISDTTIPANSMLAVLFALPRFDKTLWNNPETFNHARFFVADNKENYALLPFGFGNRRCPAEKVSEYLVKTFIAYVTMNYDLDIKNTNERDPTIKLIQRESSQNVLLRIAR